MSCGTGSLESFWLLPCLQFRSEAFNLFNHPNLGLPGVGIGAAGAGIISSVVNNERQIQIAMKLYF